MVTSLDNYIKNHRGQRALLTDCRHRDLQEVEFTEATQVSGNLVSVKTIDGADVLVPNDRLCFIMECYVTTS